MVVGMEERRTNLELDAGCVLWVELGGCNFGNTDTAREKTIDRVLQIWIATMEKVVTFKGIEH